MSVAASEEAIERFECFGSSCAVYVTGNGQDGVAREAVALARAELCQWHEHFSRFSPTSELSRLNADPRHSVPVSPLMARLASAVREAGVLTRGLIDATLIDDIESAGYKHDLGAALPLTEALTLAPPRTPASAAAEPGWKLLEVDLANAIVTRPSGVKLDSGGLAKGLFADVLGERLAAYTSFAIDCGGDLRIGGAGGATRAIVVESPFDFSPLHTFHLTHTGVATSGIGRRSWLNGEGEPAHHLLDPGTGRPAFTGIVQVTALAPSALLAEIQAKAAILSGPRAARRWLAHGGVIVFDDGSHEVISPPPTVSLSELSGYAQSARTRALQDA
jgi:thiamine biosynthesis lipoprotein